MLYTLYCPDRPARIKKRSAGGGCYWQLPVRCLSLVMLYLAKIDFQNRDCKVTDMPISIHFSENASMNQKEFIVFKNTSRKK